MLVSLRRMRRWHTKCLIQERVPADSETWYEPAVIKQRNTLEQQAGQPFNTRLVPRPRPVIHQPNLSLELAHICLLRNKDIERFVNLASNFVPRWCVRYMPLNADVFTKLLKPSCFCNLQKSPLGTDIKVLFRVSRSISLTLLALKRNPLSRTLMALKLPDHPCLYLHESARNLRHLFSLSSEDLMEGEQTSAVLNHRPMRTGDLQNPLDFTDEIS